MFQKTNVRSNRSMSSQQQQQKRNNTIQRPADQNSFGRPWEDPNYWTSAGLFFFSELENSREKEWEGSQEKNILMGWLSLSFLFYPLIFQWLTSSLTSGFSRLIQRTPTHLFFFLSFELLYGMPDASLKNKDALKVFKTSFKICIQQLTLAQIWNKHCRHISTSLEEVACWCR